MTAILNFLKGHWLKILLIVICSIIAIWIYQTYVKNEKPGLVASKIKKTVSDDVLKPSSLPKDPAGIYTVQDITHFEDLYDGTVNAELFVQSRRESAFGNIYAEFDLATWKEFFERFKSTRSGTVKVSTHLNNKPRMYRGSLTWPVTFETGKEFEVQVKKGQTNETTIFKGFEIWVNIPNYISPVRGNEYMVKNHKLRSEDIDLNPDTK